MSPQQRCLPVSRTAKVTAQVAVGACSVGFSRDAPCYAGVAVADAAAAFQAATSGGAIAVQSPLTLHDEATGTSQCVAEVKLYGDVVLRFVSGSYKVQPMVCTGILWSPINGSTAHLIRAALACRWNSAAPAGSVLQTASTPALKAQLQQACLECRGLTWQGTSMWTPPPSRMASSGWTMLWATCTICMRRWTTSKRCLDFTSLQSSPQRWAAHAKPKALCKMLACASNQQGSQAQPDTRSAGCGCVLHLCAIHR